jgi:hypothetical protein
MENMSGNGSDSPFGNGMGAVTKSSPGGIPYAPQTQKQGTSIGDQASAPSVVPGGPALPAILPQPGCYVSAPSADGAMPFGNVRG